MTEEKVPILAFCLNNLGSIQSTEAKVKLISLLMDNISSLKALSLKVFKNLVTSFTQSELKLKLRVIACEKNLLNRPWSLGMYFFNITKTMKTLRRSSA